MDELTLQIIKSLDSFFAIGDERSYAELYQAYINWTVDRKVKHTLIDIEQPVCSNEELALADTISKRLTT